MHLDPSLGYLDMEWLAIDSAGQIAIFTSAGSGYVPEPYVLRPVERQDLMQHVNALAPSGEYVIPEEPADASIDQQFWIQAAQRGIFAYDYDLQQNQAYVLLAMPLQPLFAAGIEWAQDLPVFPGRFGPSSLHIFPNAVLRWRPLEIG